MAINETVRDIENYPSKSKTVTLDLLKIIPVDNDGDEVYILSSTPGSGVAKIGGGTFNPIFIREFISGYCKSSGFKNSPFTVVSGNANLRISIDGSTYHEIILASGNGLSGEDIAADLQTKITALGGDGALEEFNVAFLNATVSFENNRFKILSGSVSNTFTGVGKSSVRVLPGLTNDASTLLGFDIPAVSEDIAAKVASEIVLTSGYTAYSGTVMAVTSTQDLTTGMAFAITDGTNREYFVASGVGANSISFVSAVTSGLEHSYATGSVVQKIFERDADADLAAPYKDIDEIVRFILRGIGNQIDFSV
jgi:hypothetical protein